MLKGGIEQKREEVGSEVSRKDRKKSVAEWGKNREKRGELIQKWETRDGWEDEGRGKQEKQRSRGIERN